VTVHRLCVVLVAAFCVARDPRAQHATAALPRAHRHPGMETPAIQDSVPELGYADTTLGATVVREQLVTDRRNRYDAFTVDRTYLFVHDRRTGRVREVRGLPLELRPFSDLTWTQDGTLLVDRWSSHYAMHYARRRTPPGGRHAAVSRP
jgi:hypothetical protein